MRVALMVGLGMASMLTAPAMAQQASEGTVIHHYHNHVYHHHSAAQQSMTAAEALGPELAARPARATANSAGPANTNGAPNAEWDCNNGDSGCTWEPEGWRKN